MKIVVERAKSGKPYWKIVARNGKTLCHSEQYNKLSDCMDTALGILSAKLHVNIKVIDKKKKMQ